MAREGPMTPALHKALTKVINDYYEQQAGNILEEPDDQPPARVSHSFDSGSGTA